MFGQLAGCKSLKDITLVLRSVNKAAYHPGIPVVVDSSSLSNANDLVGIVGDKTIHLSGYVSEKKYSEDLRLIEFYDVEKDEVITFITNNFELGSLIIANIYRNRWQIETFFKWIKGNLTIKALRGYSENAVKIHLWVAISTYLLLAWVKAELKSPLTITEISKDL